MGLGIPALGFPFLSPPCWRDWSGGPPSSGRSYCLGVEWVVCLCLLLVFLEEYKGPCRRNWSRGPPYYGRSCPQVQPSW